MRPVWIILAALMVMAMTVNGQQTEVNDSTWTEPKSVTPLKPTIVIDSAGQVDTIYYVPEKVTSPAENVTNPVDYEEHLTQQPTVALFKSMFVPGLGQFGNRKYVKGVVVAGLEIWLLSEAIRYGKQARDEKNSFEATSDPDLRDYYYSRYQERRVQRNKFSWFSGIVIFASMFDAYVDAHLSGAPDQVKPKKVDVDILPGKDGGVEASLSYSF